MHDSVERIELFPGVATSRNGGGQCDAGDRFTRGGVLAEEWLTRHINSKDMFALYEYHVLFQFCTRHPATSRRAQLLVNVDNESILGAFRKGRGQKTP